MLVLSAELFAYRFVVLDEVSFQPRRQPRQPLGVAPRQVSQRYGCRSRDDLQLAGVEVWGRVSSGAAKRTLQQDVLLHKHRQQDIATEGDVLDERAHVGAVDGPEGGVDCGTALALQRGRCLALPA